MNPHEIEGVPLESYIDESATYGIRFTCIACMDSFDVPLLEVIARLKSTGKGDEQTGIKAVAWLSTKPCTRCGELKWDTGPVHHPRPPRK